MRIKKSLVAATAVVIMTAGLAGCGMVQTGVQMPQTVQQNSSSSNSDSGSSNSNYYSDSKEDLYYENSDADYALPSVEDEIKIDLTGLYLDDAIRVLKECGVDSAYIKYEADDGKTIIVKNNWMVLSQEVRDRKIYLVCSKDRNNGIFDSIKELGRDAKSFLGEFGDAVDKIRNTADGLDATLSHFKLF